MDPLGSALGHRLCWMSTGGVVVREWHEVRCMVACKISRSNVGPERSGKCRDGITAWSWSRPGLFGLSVFTCMLTSGPPGTWDKSGVGVSDKSRPQCAREAAGRSTIRPIVGSQSSELGEAPLFVLGLGVGSRAPLQICYVGASRQDRGRRPPPPLSLSHLSRPSPARLPPRNSYDRCFSCPDSSSLASS